jgi:16S rRNA (cytidine1402-2'-O)-methyltransferase
VGDQAPASRVGTLYVVATPLGNLSDLTPRAAETLRRADLVAAEDTRRTRPLLTHIGARAPLVSFHAHSKSGATRRILTPLLEGKSVALVSDAGTPAISDPGAELVREARAAGIPVVPIPGPTAVATALAGAGLPADRFLFLGFLPRRGAERRRLLSDAAASQWTVVLFEAANRLAALLTDIERAAPDRQVVVGRELTKKFEEFKTGTAGALAAYYTERPPKGEVTVVVAGAGSRTPGAGTDDDDAERRARELVGTGMSKKEAVRVLSQETGIPRNRAYRLVMAL